MRKQKVPALLKKYGKLTIVGEPFQKIYVTSNQKRWFVKVRCDCGVEKETNVVCLGRHKNSCCGKCHARPKIFKHHLSRTRVYGAWMAMKTRCFNINVPNYMDYGGRGITVCSQWRDSFENFYADMGDRPTNRHSIERIDNDGNYEPSNCKWGTKKEQGRNRRDTKLTDLRVKHINILYKSSSVKKQKDVAFLYGISQCHVSRILNQKRWQ